MFDPKVHTYLCYQTEISATGYKHYQGYCEAKQQLRYKAAQQSLRLPTAYIHARNGTRDQAREYTRKPKSAVPGSWHEHGIWRDAGQGSRGDLQEVARLVSNGSSLTELADSHPVQIIKFGKGIASLINLKSAKRDGRTELYLHIGVSGAGKTYRAANEWRTEHPEWRVYWFNWENGWWFDGYQGEEVIIIDNVGSFDNDKPFASYNAVCRLADEYASALPVKGSTANLRAKRIYITSTSDYKRWWPKRTEWAELERRITQTRRFTKPFFHQEIKEDKEDDEIGSQCSCPDVSDHSCARAKSPINPRNTEQAVSPLQRPVVPWQRMPDEF